MTILSMQSLFAQTISKKLQLNLRTGYEQQELSWSIAGNSAGQNPNIYSELQWKKIGGQLLSTGLLWNIWSRVTLTADYSRVFISSGTVSDNDYGGDNRTSPLYNQLFNADKGYTQNWSVGAGYTVITNNSFSLIPYVGYGANKQSLHLLDRTGNFPDLNSTYETDWKGPFVRVNAKLKLANKLSLNSRLTYNQVNYNAKADWNLIQTFQHPVSYRHNAKGFGADGNAAVCYDITKNIALNIGGGYFTWQTGKGADELFLSSGATDKTQLNKVGQKGYRLFGGFVFSY
jgi:hypothetical protein